MKSQARKNNRHFLYAALVIAAFTACSGGASIPQGASPRLTSSRSSSGGPVPTYHLVVLGNGLVPQKINNAGIVVGLDLNTNRPFEYKNGQVTDLPLFPGDTSGNVFDINDHEQIVGQTINSAAVGPYLDSNNPCFGTCPEAHAVLYDRGRISNLGSISQPPGGAAPVFNSADVINDNGVIAGESGAVQEGGLIRIVIFSPGTIRTFPDAQFPGAIEEGPQGPTEVNNAGEIVGAAQSIFYPVLLSYPNAITCSPPLEVRYHGFDGINNAGDTISHNFYAGILDGGSVYCVHGRGQQLQLVPSGLNDRGDIVGSVIAAQTEIFSGGKFYKVADAATGHSDTSTSNAIHGTRVDRYFISREKAIQGYGLSVSAGDALLYSKGTYYDLNDLVSNHPELILQNPKSINNRGQIVGFTITPNFQGVGWLLVPR